MILPSAADSAKSLRQLGSVTGHRFACGDWLGCCSASDLSAGRRAPKHIISNSSRWPEFLITPQNYRDLTALIRSLALRSSCTYPARRRDNNGPRPTFPQVRNCFLLVGDTGSEPVASSVSGIISVLKTLPLSTKSVRACPPMSTRIRGRYQAISQSANTRTSVDVHGHTRGRADCYLAGDAHLAAAGSQLPLTGPFSTGFRSAQAKETASSKVGVGPGASAAGLG